jgi:uncharacterized membrane protein YbhN (UPF0104 family)
MAIPTLLECQTRLVNKERDNSRHRSQSLYHKILDMILETIMMNALGATTFFCVRHTDFTVKLDFSFLAFAVVFPLTFLIQTVFSRRDAALSSLADFKASLLSTVLFTLTVDWKSQEGYPTRRGRLELPEHFNANVLLQDTNRSRSVRVS